MIINHNLMAMNTHRQLAINQSNASKSMEKLSSGFRINRAGDDAAGLAISEKMRGQIRGLKQAQRNAQDGISLIQTAEGALNETHAILQRMRELATQSATDTNTAVDRGEIQKEIDQLAEELTRIANNTEFNTQTLLNGGITEGGVGDLKFHIGSNKGQNISLTINAMDAKSLGVARDVYTASVSDAVNVLSATLATETGSAVFDGGAADLTANATAAKATWNSVAGLDLTTKVNTSKYNDLKVAVETGGSAGDPITATYDEATNTLTLKGHTTQADWTAANVNAALVAAGFGDLEATGDASAAAANATAAGPTADGLGDDEVELTLTQDATTESVIVKNSAMSVSFTSDEFSGISLKLDGELSGTTAATIRFNQEKASAARFETGKKVTDASAKAGINVSNQAAASDAIEVINTAIETVSTERSKLGAIQNRLEHTIANLGTSAENLQAAEARIRDLDMAEEIMAFTKNNILQQAATAMLAQANQQPQSVLQLLR
jgi:flagellin